VAEFNKIALRSSIDSLISELNNEIVNISEDIAKAKQGIMINVDSRRTKRKVRRLDMEAADINAKVQELAV
jgi:hypothetical protein